MNDTLIGKPIKRIDALDKVTGRALYPNDFNKPDQLYMKTIFAERPHAIVKSIDAGKAQALEGVLMVLTSKDVPCNEYGLMKFDQPVLCGPDSGIPYADHVRFPGDQVALIIAENSMIAEKAAGLIDINYEDLPVLDTPEEAMREGAVLLHPDCPSNQICHFQIRYGDINKGFEQADVIVESDYTTPSQEHAYLQPEAGMAYIDEAGRITVVVAGQFAHEDREQIMHALNLPEDKVRVIYPAIGGAFGGREDMSVQITLALSVMKLHEIGIDRPVKTVWTRRESIIGHHKRHPYRIHTKWGATKAGKLVAMQADIISDGGAYMYTSNKVLENTLIMVPGPYRIPNVWIDGKVIATNNIPNGAFRGFGAPQGCFAAEMQMNKLAEALGMDPVEFRLLNTLKEGEETSVRSPLPKGISIEHVIRDCAKAAGWDNKGTHWTSPRLSWKDTKAPHILHGIGISAGFKNVGFSYGAPENCWAGITLLGKDKIEKVILKHAGADVGQGAHTAFIQIAANVLNVPVDIIEIVVSDTAVTENSGSSSASRMTFMGGNAVLGAAQAALEKWKNEERPAEATFVYRPPRTTPLDPETGACTPNFCYGYAADAVEVSVDTRTGKVVIEKVICADDVGRAINKQQVKGQIEGAIVQAGGYAVLENFVQQKGKVKTDSLSTYLIPTIMDIPEKVESIIIEDIDPIGPNGARGVGEIPYIPLAPAVMMAMHEATGVWFDGFPLLEERVLEGLGVLNKKQ
ncbi:MAG: xanthine dehydrogenase family protein [Anaerolineae bacterium]|nr:xanthine dehydrogenase family protein [Anaerolineae bacterium]